MLHNSCIFMFIAGVLYFCNSTINPILYNSMSKKFRLAFKRTLCRCYYTADELLELNGKSKSIYCSDRITGHSIRQATNNITKMTSADLNGMKNGSGLLNKETLREMTHQHGGCRPQRCICFHSHSTGRLNEILSETDRVHSDRCNGFGPRAAGVKYQSSTNSSLVSFCDLESDSIIELKSCSSSNLLNSNLLAVPQNSNSIRKASYV